MGAGASTQAGAHDELAEAEEERVLLGISESRLRKLLAGFRFLAPAPEDAVTLSRFQEVIGAPHAYSSRVRRGRVRADAAKSAVVGAPPFVARLFVWMAAPGNQVPANIHEAERLTLSFPSFVRGCYLYCARRCPASHSAAPSHLPQLESGTLTRPRLLDFVVALYGGSRDGTVGAWYRVACCNRLRANWAHARFTRPRRCTSVAGRHGP